jgi:hypothetical protein
MSETGGDKKSTKLLAPDTARLTAWMVRNWDRYTAAKVHLADYLKDAEAGTGLTGLTRGKVYHITLSIDTKLSDILIRETSKKRVKPPPLADILQTVLEQVLKLIAKSNGENVGWSAAEVKQLKLMLNSLQARKRKKARRKPPETPGEDKVDWKIPGGDEPPQT